jgi:hypothetical protein
MTILNRFFSAPIAFGILGLVLFVIGLLIKQNRGRKLMLTVSLFLYARYIMLWRLLYTIPTNDPASMILKSVVYLANSTDCVSSVSLPISSGHRRNGHRPPLPPVPPCTSGLGYNFKTNGQVLDANIQSIVPSLSISITLGG